MMLREKTTTINERIKLLIIALGLNNNSFAKMLNVSPTVTFNIISGRNTKPSFELLEKIVFTYDNVSSDWILRGVGLMFVDNSGQEVITPMIQPQNTQPSLTNDSKNIAIEVLKDQLKETNMANRELLSIIKNFSESFTDRITNP